MAIRKPWVFGFLFVVVTLVIIVWCLKYPLFWPLAAFPGFSFLVFQFVAFRFVSERFFLVTDYIYYVLISGAVVLGSQYLQNAELVSYLDTRHEQSALERRIESIDRELPLLRARQEQAERRKPDTEELELQCLIQRLRLTEPGRRGRGPTEPPSLCDAALYAQMERASLPARIQEAERERGAAVSRLSILVKVRQPSEGPLRVSDLERRFIWLPTLVLAGITLKIGKTTAGLFSTRV